MIDICMKILTLTQMASWSLQPPIPGEHAVLPEVPDSCRGWHGCRCSAPTRHLLSHHVPCCLHHRPDSCDCGRPTVGSIGLLGCLNQYHLFGGCILCTFIFLFHFWEQLWYHMGDAGHIENRIGQANTAFQIMKTSFSIAHFVGC